MNKLPYILGIFLLISIISLGFFEKLSIALKQEETISISLPQSTPASEIYSMQCARCHGRKQERFANRKWMYGGSEKEVALSIKYGRPSLGMPSFESSLSDNQINNVTIFLLEAITANSNK